ncbi:YdeI/OmpD-associated family protein [Winogradskyella psychrotolerans]|uniref:YdeI/OmpD-associated family protein n=1 Tax=Winogradskyella psychrotolerans TaxID=1344585 RepID=UPI001C06DD70|nr:YdeI/OmpD-associated family protein [Winogradskyella psychrotolerans]MBU2929653.1 YdeI/OmpD-associated family protein [Winogradskyella psychrotolerans]
MKTPELYFKTDIEWREWLHSNHDTIKGVQLIFFKVDHANDSMRWEEAVKVALCFGWIDSTVKSLGDGKRRQYFCPRQPKSVWSAVNKKYIVELSAQNLIHESGHKSINIAKENGSWSALDAVEQGIIPENLQKAFKANPNAYNNYLNFAPSYRKSYLYWLNQAKRETTQQKRIAEIIKLCDANIKSRDVR